MDSAKQLSAEVARRKAEENAKQKEKGDVRAPADNKTIAKLERELAAGLAKVCFNYTAELSTLTLS